ncbi:hypothetical protein [Streptomyces avicenniae]|uniref:hypothetical protein n=1 Tax=Streptomyces avicenniae TaxID=500153 RepID=UPI0006992A34|nr:hypothetical protein [Streptomyces avicenniae]
MNGKGKLLLGAALAAAVVPLALPATAVADTAGPTVTVTDVGPAAPGEWDYLGSRNFWWSSAGGHYRTDHVNSGGGDFQICVAASSNTRQGYVLREYDPDSADEYVGPTIFLASGDCVVYRGIGGYVDGTNNRAEFYFSTLSSLANSASYWD